LPSRREKRRAKPLPLKVSEALVGGLQRRGVGIGEGPQLASRL
jgi:hypothetical protein